MNKSKISFKIFIVFFFYISINFAQTSKEKKINELLSKMTLEEKIGQLVQIVGTGKVNDSIWIREGRVGSYLIGVWDPEKGQEVQKIAVKESRLGIPLLFANDIIHGYSTIFPIPLASASSWNPALVEEACSIAAFEAASHGTHWTYAPMVDIARDPRWGRVMEGSGEDPYLGSVMAAARVRGFQGENLQFDKIPIGKIAATAKHYTAYGAAEGGRDYNSANIGERTLREVYLPPFKAAVDNGIASIMSAFNDIDGVPASANHFTLTDILKEEWKFSGVVISDFNSIAELIPHGIAENKSEAALKALTAGVDVDMVGDTSFGNIYSPSLEKLINNKKLSEDYINNSVRRVLGLKYDLGLFEKPYIDKNYFEKNKISKEEKNKTALQLAEESIVLLKNEDNILPLRKNIKSIALIGPLANDKENLQGSWAGAGEIKNVVSILEGIRNKLGLNIKINFEKGCEINDSSDENFQAAIKAAKNSDIAVLAIGEFREMTGEAASKTNLNLPGVQLDLVKKIYSTGVPVIVILMNGRPLTINWIAKNVKGIIEAWYLGDQAGNAIANVLFGDYNPSGKLPITFPRSVGQIPIYYDHKNTGRPFSPTDKYTSKYLDSPNTPLYPFGYGLSYTTFKYENMRVFPEKISLNDTITVSVDIKNTGNFTGDEVVQLYIHDLSASVARPVKELKGFKKINLKPGETKKITFKIFAEMLSFYGLQMEKIIEPGKFDVMIGGNSVELISKTFELVSN